MPNTETITETKTTDAPTMACLTLVKTSDGYFLQYASDKSGFAAFKDLNEGLASFEEMYEGKHANGYESSMSATIWWMQFQPSLIQIPEKDLPSLFTPEEHAAGLQLTTLSSMAGRMLGVKVTHNAEALWNAGLKPRLIQP